MKRILTLLVIATLNTAHLCAEPSVKSLVRDGDRVLFVGDSITGHGWGGFIRLFKQGMDEARPGSNITVVGLGGSGQGVGSWAHVEKQSRTKDSFLDIKKFNVRTNLDQPAGVLVVMLGMNDTLSPYSGESKEDVAKWGKRYRELLVSLRKRCRPRVTGLATITPNTEDPRSPKNITIEAMNKELKAIAKELKCVMLPTNETITALLRKGRTYKPDFHIAPDFVHPNHGGHVAMAMGMLEGLGEVAAAKKLQTMHLDGILERAKGELPALSYTIVPTTKSLTSDKSSFKITYFWTPTGGDAEAKAKLFVPSGWTCKPAVLKGETGTFKVRGKLKHLENILKLAVKTPSTTKEVEIKIPAPWLIGHGFSNMQVWERPGFKFNPQKGAVPGQADFMKGIGFGSTPKGWKGDPLKWSRYIASVDHTGGNTPGNISMFAVSYSGTFDGAFGVRWITSKKELPIKLTISNRTFAGNTGLDIALNGKAVYTGVITKERGKRVEKTCVLKKGLNCLVFKANHFQWQWQFAIEMSADNPADLADLVISTVPRKNGTGRRWR